MPIDLSCECGWNSRVKDDYAGKRAKCPSCGAVLTVPAREIDVEEAAAYALLDDERDQNAPSASAPSLAAPIEEKRTPRSSRALTNSADPTAPRKKINIKFETREPSESRMPRIVLSPGTAGGLGLMLLGGIFIAIRLASDRVPIYGVILFFIGLVQVLRGIMGKEEE